ncbi:MAG: flagellar basal body rod protein FlgC [Opitutales bacterium]
MNLLPGISPSVQALDAERVRMDLIAQNIANAHTTRGPDGEVYQRKLAVFESFMDPEMRGAQDRMLRGVRLAGVMDDPAQGERVYNPGHPHADPNGMVSMPNVKMAREMVDLITSQRGYQANLEAVRAAREMARHALQISS